ncbi:hypothetical protein MRX96_022011 [Rhipicephalus microplus]
MPRMARGKGTKERKKRGGKRPHDVSLCHVSASSVDGSFSLPRRPDQGSWRRSGLNGGAPLLPDRRQGCRHAVAAASLSRPANWAATPPTIQPLEYVRTTS